MHTQPGMRAQTHYTHTLHSTPLHPVAHTHTYTHTRARTGSIELEELQVAVHEVGLPQLSPQDMADMVRLVDVEGDYRCGAGYLVV